MEDIKARVQKYLKRAEPLFGKLKKTDSKDADKVFDMAMGYYLDSKHFYEKGEYVNSLAALEYAEGWMDAGKEIGLLE
jgi:hypothetical protein